jgi:TorA maturation chaperone TorD
MTPPPAAHAPERQVDEVDIGRAREYALLAGLLLRAPDQKLLDQLSGLKADPSSLGLAHAALAEAAAATNSDNASREFFDLFIGLGRGELLPYASYYLTGSLHERPLARLRADLAELGLETARSSEPEDHAGHLCEIMSALIMRSLDTPAGADRTLFEKHLSAWIGRFFGDLEQAHSADFYRAVGRLGRVFIEIEADAFAIPE